MVSDAENGIDPGDSGAGVPSLSALKNVAVGRAIGVADVQVEGEMLDSVTGVRLAAGIDRRVGGASFEGQFDKWDDIKDSFDTWATNWHQGLVELQNQKSS